MNKFTNTVKAEWLEGSLSEGDRNMMLLEPISFFDPQGIEWYGHAGAIVNGASIPRLLWSTTGSPYIGPYRKAAVLHDIHCRLKKRPWEDVHRMFYEAMLCSGTPKPQALKLYLAVMMFGPRWDEEGCDIEVCQDGIEDLASE